MFMFLFGVACAHLSCKLVVAAMSKSPVEMLDYCMAGPLSLALYSYFDVGLWLQMVNVSVTEYTVLVCALVFTSIHFIQYCYRMCYEISAYFGIDVFRIPYNKGE